MKITDSKLKGLKEFLESNLEKSYQQKEDLEKEEWVKWEKEKRKRKNMMMS